MEKTCEFFDVPLELESYEIACYDLLRVMIENAGLQEQKLELAQELSRLVDHPLVIKDPRIVNLLETQISPTFGSLSLKRSSTKLNWVLDKITRLLQEDPRNKIVIFSKYQPFLSILSEHFQEKLGTLYQQTVVNYYSISTKETNQRNSQLLRFQTLSECRIFLSMMPSENARSSARDLSAANHVIMCEPTWDYITTKYATSLVYHEKQTRNVRVWRPIMLNTIEEKMDKHCIKKATGCKS